MMYVLLTLSTILSLILVSETKSNEEIRSCEVAVIGSGWGGVYFAWRTTVDSHLFSPRQVCIFEANSRLGGRAYSVYEENIKDVYVDLGAYRFTKEHTYIHSLLTNKYNMSTTCYDQSDPSCKYLVISDHFGNNAGFIKGIEAMITDFQNIGGRIFRNFKLDKIEDSDFSPKSEQQSNQLMKLTFTNGYYLDHVSKLFLNIPNSAVNKLDPESIIFTESPPEMKSLFETVFEVPAARLLLVYEDAWWVNYLNKSAGEFEDMSNSNYPPIQGTYHDGPVKCSQNKCSGVLMSYYGWDSFAFEYYSKYQEDLRDPMVMIDPFSSFDHLTLLRETHRGLMSLHKEQLTKMGMDPNEIKEPFLGYLALWWAKQAQGTLPSEEYITPPKAFSTFGRIKSQDVKELVSKPIPNRDIYMSNQAWTNDHWANGCLDIVEYTLQNHLYLNPPNWLV